jgi:hypothetical protein
MTDDEVQRASSADSSNVATPEASVPTTARGRSPIPAGAWAGLGIAALTLIGGILFAATDCFGALQPAAAAATPSASTSGTCSTWPMCETPTPTPTVRVPQQPTVTSDVPMTASLPYDGALRAASLSQWWTQLPETKADHQVYSDQYGNCELTIDHMSAAPMAGTDQEQTEALLAQTYARYEGDRKMSNVRRTRLASEWVPVAGASGRVEFTTEKIDFNGADDGTKYSDTVMVRVIAAKRETVYAELQCANLPGDYPAAFGALQFQER